MSTEDICVKCGHFKSDHSLQPGPVFCISCKKQDAIHLYIDPRQAALFS